MITDGVNKYSFIQCTVCFSGEGKLPSLDNGCANLPRILNQGVIN